MSPFDYIVWEKPPSKQAVAALAWFFVNEDKYVLMLKDSDELVADVLKTASANAAASGFDLGRAQHLARVVESEHAARAALKYIDSVAPKGGRAGVRP